MYSKYKMNDNVIISIEGNIGSGKSTLLANLQTHFKNNKKIIFLREPVDLWESITDEHGTSMLKLFYHDQKTHAFAFQMMAYISRLGLLKEAIANNHGAIIITERCLYTDKMVFAKMLFDSGDIKLENYKIYLKWFDTFVSDFPISKVIYVKTAPEICCDRIIKRSRTGEDNIPLEYLIKCNEYHESMLDTNCDTCICREQLVLNGDIDIYENEHELITWINQTTVFIQDTNVNSFSSKMNELYNELQNELYDNLLYFSKKFN